MLSSVSDGVGRGLGFFDLNDRGVLNGVSPIVFDCSSLTLAKYLLIETTHYKAAFKTFYEAPKTIYINFVDKVR